LKPVAVSVAAPFAGLYPYIEGHYCAKRIHSSPGYLTPAAVRGSVV